MFVAHDSIGRKMEEDELVLWSIVFPPLLENDIMLTFSCCEISDVVV